MSDQRRTDLSQPKTDTLVLAPGPGRAERLAHHRQRLPLYAGAALALLLVLAWIDGGAEPLHPITQAVDLNSPVAEAD